MQVILIIIFEDNKDLELYLCKVEFDPSPFIRS